MIDLAFSILSDVRPGQIIESLIFLGVLIWKLRPHLKIIEDRMQGIEKSLTALDTSMTKSFQAGEKRFSSLEHRLELLDDRLSDIEELTAPRGERE